MWPTPVPFGLLVLRAIPLWLPVCNSLHHVTKDLPALSAYSTTPVVESGITSASFWADVPHYISAAPNPKAALALVNRVETFLHFTIDTTELQNQAFAFDAKVSQAIVENPQMAAYVRQLEARDQEENLDVEPAPAPKGNGGGNGHANGKDMEEELQRFLRHRKDRKDDE